MKPITIYIFMGYCVHNQQFKCENRKVYWVEKAFEGDHFRAVDSVYRNEVVELEHDSSFKNKLGFAYCISNLRNAASKITLTAKAKAI